MSSSERSSNGVIMRADKDLIKPKVGLGIATASIFLAGEMAGSGVLALPSAVVSTGWKQYQFTKYWLHIIQSKYIISDISNFIHQMKHICRMARFSTYCCVFCKCRLHGITTWHMLGNIGRKTRGVPQTPC